MPALPPARLARARSGALAAVLDGALASTDRVVRATRSRRLARSLAGCSRRRARVR